MLQIHQPGLSYHAIAGKLKTEGPYCETRYLEERATAESFGYCDSLIALDAQLGNNKNQQDAKAPQYRKLYKGENRYE